MRPGEPAGPTDRKGSPPNRALILAIGRAEVNRPSTPCRPSDRAVYGRRSGEVRAKTRRRKRGLRRAETSSPAGGMRRAARPRQPPYLGEVGAYEGMLRCEPSGG